MRTELIANVKAPRQILRKRMTGKSMLFPVIFVEYLCRFLSISLIQLRTIQLYRQFCLMLPQCKKKP